MNKAKQLMSKLFGVSSSEFVGFRLVALTAIFCIIGLGIVTYLSQSPYANYQQDARKLDSLLLFMDDQKVLSPLEPVHLKNFDPNTVSGQKLVNYGFPPWLATRLVKYRSTGARFKEPNDLLKLYGFPDSLFLQVVDYVVIAPVPVLKHTIVQPQKVLSEEKHVINKKLPVFDLNLADTAIFQTIKGIGSKLSNRIVEYRLSLGGFVSANQLYQIYRLDSAVVNKIIEGSIIAADFAPDKININKATKEQLAAHPYINWIQAKLIIAYRNQHGAFTSLQDILKVYSIDENWIKNNEPYLSF